MNKKLLLAYKILLPVLIVAVGAFIVFMFTSVTLRDTDSEQGLAYVLMFLFNAFPLLALAVLGGITLIITILVIVLGKKLPVIITSLVFLCLLLPLNLWETFVSFGMSYFAELPVLAVLALCLNIANIVISAILIRQGKKAANNPHPQREEQNGQLPPGYGY